MSGFRANSIVNRDGTGAPNIPNGIVATGATFTQVSSVNATFSGNLTIGGTVSYQEVENIDAVGVVTAQQGIQVEANGLTVTGVGTFNNPIKVVGVTTADANGLNVAGVITATSLKGSGANLTGVLPTLSGIASGSLSNGQTVIIQSDGTVAGVVGNTQVGVTTIFESSTVYRFSSAFDSTNNKVVIAYRGPAGNYHGTAVVATVTGIGITVGSGVEFEGAAIDYPAATFDSANGKIVITYRDGGNSNKGTAVVGTVSGDSISFGTPVVIDGSSNTRYNVIAYDSTNGKVVIAYRDHANNGYGTALVGTVSGTSISFGSPVVFESAAIADISIAFDSSNGKVVIAYEHGSNGGTAIVGTVSGTSISFGSAVVYTSSSTTWNSATFDSTNGKVVIAYRDSGNSQYGTAVVGTVSGTSISFGSAVVFESSDSRYLSAIFDSSEDKVVIAYEDHGDSNKGKVVVGTVSGTSISFDDPITFESGNTEYYSATFDSTNNRTVIVFKNDDDGRGEAVVFRTVGTNLTSTNFLGFSNAAYTDGQTATIQITGSVDDAQSGLTTARKHYVQNDGTLSTTAGSPSVEAGVAISATEIIVKG